MTAYEMRISDWSSDVCSSDLLVLGLRREFRIGQLDRHDRGQSFTHVVASERDLLLLQRARFFRIVDRKSVVSGKSVSVRVDLGGRRIIKKKQISNHIQRLEQLK